MKNINFLKICILVILIACIVSFSITPISFADTTDNWHGFKGDSGHTGFIDQKMDKKLGLQWRFFFAGDYLTPIQVFGDSLYFLDRTGYLYSIKREDSTQNYKVSVVTTRTIIGLDCSDKYIFVATGPAFSRNRQQNAQDSSCLIIAYNRLTGEKIWENKYDGSMITTPIADSNVVYFAIGKTNTTNSKTTGGDLFCLNGLNGEVVYDSQVEEYAFGFGSTYLSMAEGVVIISGMKYDRSVQYRYPPKLFAFNTKTGSQIWTEVPDDENKSFGIPSIKGGFVYVMENPGGGFFGGGGPPGGGPPGGGGGGPPGGGGEPPGGDRPGAGTRANQEAWLLKIDLQTGKVDKSMNIKNENFGNFCPTLAQDAIYINSFTGKIFCINYTLEKIYWTKTYNRFSFNTELTATQNYLYTCLYDGTFICISKEDGSIQYRYTIGKNAGIPVVSGSEVFVSGEALYCFSLNAKPLLLTEPSTIDFGVIKKGLTKQLSFSILYTGLENLSGELLSDTPWLSIKPRKITGNIQTFFAAIDTSKMLEGKQTGSILVNTNFGNKTITVSIEITVPPPLPLTVNIKEDPMITNQKSFTIIGKTEPVTKIVINNLDIYSDYRGQFTHSIMLHEGINLIKLEAVSKDKREAKLEYKIKLDTVPPVLEANIIKDQNQTDQWIISGNTESDVQIYIKDQVYNPSPDGSFTIKIIQELDQSEIIISAKDTAGNVTNIKLTMY
jgi:hypothetical protein